MPRMSIRSIRYRRPAHVTWDTDLERAIFLDTEQYPAPWDLSAFFTREAPIEIEIGFGKGRYLMAAAERWPERNWLGIEYATPCVQLVAERAAKRDLRNVRLIRADAGTAIENVPATSVSAYHVYFPDPWPKKRHHKRRLIQTPFAEKLRRTLVPAGVVNLATDYGEYFDEMLPAMQAAGFELVDLPADRPEDDEVFRTNYEKKWLDQRKTIHRARFRNPA